VTDIFPYSCSASDRYSDLSHTRDRELESLLIQDCLLLCVLFCESGSLKMLDKKKENVLSKINESYGHLMAVNQR
jgi:hypothetical protein